MWAKWGGVPIWSPHRELLVHSEEGVFKYVIQAFFQLVTKSILYEIDLLAMELLSVCPRQSHRSKFPRCSFTHGISRTAKLTCTEQTGLLFTLSILIATDRCRTYS